MIARNSTLVFLIALLFSTQVTNAHGSNQAGTANNHNAKALVGLLDSTLDWNWGTTAYDQLVTGSFNTYGAHNNLSNNIFKNYSGGNWINYHQDNYTYDNSNNITTDVYQTWNGTAWGNSQQWTYTYDGNNNELSMTAQLYTSGNWVNNSQVFNHYTGNVLTSGSQQTWQSNAWVTTDSFTYTYDGSNNLLTELDLNWSGTAWVNNNQYVYTYSGNNMTSNTVQAWDGTTWQNQTKDVYTYDGNSNLIKDVSQVYNGSIASNQQQLFFGYDANNNNISIVNQQYMGNAWVNSDSSHLYYQEVVSSVADVTGFTAAINIYPNPTRSTINIMCNNTTNEPVIATLYDVTGRAVITRQVSNGVTQMSVNSFAAGIYQMVFADNKGNKTVKQIVIQ